MNRKQNGIMKFLGIFLMLSLLTGVAVASDLGDCPPHGQFRVFLENSDCQMATEDSSGLCKCLSENLADDNVTYVLGTDEGDDTWYQFMNGADHTGYSTSDAPDDNQVSWVTDELEGMVGSASPVIYNGRAYVIGGFKTDEWGNPTSDEAYLYCVDVENGAVVWKSEILPPACGSWSSPACNDGNIFVSTGSETKCIDAESGETVWTFVNPSGSASCNGGPAIAEGKVFCSDWDGHNYYCVDESDGHLLWTFEVAKDEYVQGTPAYDDGMVYLTSWMSKGHIYCVDAASGEQKWVMESPNGACFCGSPSVSGDFVFVASYNFGGDGPLYALSKEDGSVIWKQYIERTDSTPTVAYGNVYITGGCKGFSDHATYCFDAVTGTKKWEINASTDDIGGWTNSIAVADGKVFVGTESEIYFHYNHISALDAETGELIWNYDQGGGSPAISDGKVFTIGDDDQLYAFGEKQILDTIVISPEDPEVYAGGWQSFDAVALDENGKEIRGVDFTWYVSDEDIGTIDENGLFKAFSDDTVTVYAEFGDLTGSVEATVTSLAPFDNSDWTVFQKDNWHTGCTNESAPIVPPDINASWAVKTASGGWSGIDASPVIYEDNIYVVASNGSFWAIDKTSGDISWMKSTDTAYFVVGSPVIGNDRAFVQTTSGRVFCFDAHSGDEFWNVTPCGGFQINTPLVYDAGYLYFGAWFDNYYCYDEDGNEIWNRPPKTGRGYYWAGTAVVGDSLVYGDDAGNLTSVNKMTGETIDEIDVSETYGVESNEIRSSVAYDHDTRRLYFTSKGSYCFTLGINEDGTFDISDAACTEIGYTTSTPAIYNGRVYVGTGSFTGGSPLYCLDADTLEVIWKYEGGNGGIQSSPVISTAYDDGDGEVYIYFTTNCANGSLFCLKDTEENEEPQLQWVYEPPRDKAQYSLPGAVFSDGWIYYGNDAGYLFGLTAPVVDTVVVEITEMFTGDEAQLVATAFDAGGNEIPGAAFTWSSEDSNVGTVSPDGVFKAENLGEINVTASLGDVKATSLVIVGDYTIDLKEGWNLVSTPERLADDHNTVKIFENVDKSGNSVLHYDAIHRWTSLDESSPVKPLDGMWVYSKDNYSVALFFDKNPLQTPPTRELIQGWNTIGFSDVTPASAKASLFTVEDSWATVIGFDSDTQSYDTSVLYGGAGEHGEMRQLLPTRGYWLYMKDNGELVAIS